VPPTAWLLPLMLAGLDGPGLGQDVAPGPAPRLALGAPAQPVPLSLGEARARAVRGGPEVLLARQRESVSRAQIDTAAALPNPTLGVQTASVTAKLTASLLQPLPLFGQRGTGIDAARADAEVARLDIAAVAVEARLGVTAAWLDLWAAQERARLLALAAGDAARVAEIAHDRFATGSGPRLDEVRTTGERARARAEADAAALAVPAASARLGVWMGDGAEARWQAAGTPAIGPLPDEARALQQLFERHPALRRDRAQALAATQHVRAEQRARWPIVTAQLSVAADDPTTPGTDVIAGLSFEAPVLNLRGGPIARARAEQSLAELQAQSELRRLTAQLGDAYRQSEAAALRARALTNDVLPALEEALRMTEGGYRDGRVDLLRVLDVQRALLESRLAALEAQATWQRALAELERAIGTPVEEAQ